MDRFNLTASITCRKLLPLVYTKTRGVDVWLCMCGSMSTLCEEGIDSILTGCWLSSLREAEACLDVRWESQHWGVMRQSDREGEREEGICQGQRTMTISCLSQQTWTQHYQDRIIYSTALKCDTQANTHAQDIHVPQIQSRLHPWSLLQHCFKLILYYRYNIDRVNPDYSTTLQSHSDLLSLFTPFSLLFWFYSCGSHVGSCFQWKR